MNAAQQPRSGEVHLYRIDLSHPPLQPSRLEQLLSPSEAERAGLLRNDAAKKRFIAGRGVLREILGGYLGVAPQKVRISTGKHGKPYLADGEEHIRFNLAHTGDVLILAVSAGLELGVDIEAVEEGKPLPAMAKIAFSPREQEELLLIPSSQLRTKAFYRLWTRKEACLKACGTGLSSLTGSSAVNYSTDDTVSCEQSFWHIIDITVPHPYCAALAVEAPNMAQSPPKIVWVVPEL